MVKSSHIRLGVNIDHVATIRNARGGRHPDPVAAAKLAIAAGCDGITAHLREDRRHIRDDDIARLKAEIAKPLNMEMAATEEMLAIALKTHPHAVCVVPEKRTERTTEGGLDAVRQKAQLAPVVSALKHAGIRVSLFIGAQPAQIETAAALGAPVIEIHTGAWCDALMQGNAVEAQADTGLTVSYPSDCRHCVLAVAGVDAAVVCDGATLEMRFPRPGSPRELVAAFAAVRSAFALSKDAVLAGLL